MKRLLAALMSSGETSTSMPSCDASLVTSFVSILPRDFLCGVSCGAVVGCGVAVVSSCDACGLGGQIIADPGLAVMAGLVWGVTGALMGTGDETLPSLSLPLLTSLPLILLLSILLYTVGGVALFSVLG